MQIIYQQQWLSDHSRSACWSWCALHHDSECTAEQVSHVGNPTYAQSCSRGACAERLNAVTEMQVTWDGVHSECCLSVSRGACSCTSADSHAAPWGSVHGSCWTAYQALSVVAHGPCRFVSSGPPPAQTRRMLVCIYLHQTSRPTHQALMPQLWFTIRPGCAQVQELVAALKARGLRVAAGSSAKREELDLFLHRLGIEQQLDATVSSRCSPDERRMRELVDMA
jgi:hypothetical protein